MLDTLIILGTIIFGVWAGYKFHAWLTMKTPTDIDDYLKMD